MNKLIVFLSVLTIAATSCGDIVESMDEANTIQESMKKDMTGNQGVSAPAGATCMPTLQVRFSMDSKRVQVISDKHINNIVMEFHDGETEMNISLNHHTFLTMVEGSEENEGKCLVRVWVKSGCNSSGEGPAYGERFENDNYTGTCETDDETPAGGVNIEPGEYVGHVTTVTEQPVIVIPSR